MKQVDLMKQKNKQNIICHLLRKKFTKQTNKQSQREKDLHGRYTIEKYNYQNSGNQNH